MLINKVTEIQNYLPISVATSFETIQPFIESSERKFIKDILGYEAYTELVKYYNAVQSSGSYGSGQDEMEAYNKLLELVQKSLANLAYYHGFAILSVAASDGGFHRIESENHKGLYKYQEEELKDLFKKDGFNGLDDVLEYLEENIEYFPEFENSENRLVTQSNIIPDTKTFNTIYNIGNSRLVFLLLKRFMRQTEDFVIRKILGHTLFADVKTEIIKPEPAERILNLLPYLQKTIAYLSIASGIDEMGVNVTDKMVYFESQQPTFMNSTVKTPATSDQLAIIKNKAEKTGNKYLEDIKLFLLDNATTYTEYSGQQGYIYSRDNAGKKTFFAG